MPLFNSEVKLTISLPLVNTNYNEALHSTVLTDLEVQVPKASWESDFQGFQLRLQSANHRILEAPSGVLQERCPMWLFQANTGWALTGKTNEKSKTSRLSLVTPSLCVHSLGQVTGFFLSFPTYTPPSLLTLDQFAC